MSRSPAAARHPPVHPARGGPNGPSRPAGSLFRRDASRPPGRAPRRRSADLRRPAARDRVELNLLGLRVPALATGVPAPRLRAPHAGPQLRRAAPLRSDRSAEPAQPGDRAGRPLRARAAGHPPRPPRGSRGGTASGAATSGAASPSAGSRPWSRCPPSPSSPRIPAIRDWYGPSMTTVPGVLLTNILDLVPTEFLLRGFVLFALLRAIGPFAVVVAARPVRDDPHRQARRGGPLDARRRPRLRLAQLADGLDLGVGGLPRRHPDRR